MTAEWICPVCETGITASDYDTLVWGICEHRSVHVRDRLGEQLVADGVSLLDRQAVLLCVALHRRPFRLVRADGGVLEVA